MTGTANPRSSRPVRRALAALGIAAMLIAACGGSPGLDARLGGDATREVTGRNSFGFAAPTLTNSRVFEIGDSFFTQNWVIAPASTQARDGLGPMMNAQACSSCHLLDGRGIPASTGDGEFGLLLRLSVVPGDGFGGPEPHPVDGDQLQDRSIFDVPAEGELVITHDERPGYDDGTPYSLRAPTYRIETPAYGPLGDDVLMSPRLAPQVIGDGLADGRPDFDATGTEWRTPPLWGLGLIEDVNGARFLLHDGRARTLEEAILWHGGEAERAKEAFRTADATVRADLIAFLEAL